MGEPRNADGGVLVHDEKMCSAPCSHLVGEHGPEMIELPSEYEVLDPAADDFAHSMSMWVWMNENGLTARKEAA